MTAPKPGEIGSWCWHVHHNILVEKLRAPLSVRVAYVRKNKKAKEVPTRLRLMHPVRGKLPLTAWNKAHVFLNKACVDLYKDHSDWTTSDYEKADAVWVKAYAAIEKAYSALQTDPATLALHAKECPDCPWDGTTIFPKLKEGRP